MGRHRTAGADLRRRRVPAHTARTYNGTRDRHEQAAAEQAAAEQAALQALQELMSASSADELQAAIEAAAPHASALPALEEEIARSTVRLASLRSVESTMQPSTAQVRALTAARTRGR